MTRLVPSFALNPAIAGLEPAASIQLSDRVKMMIADGQNVVDLTIGEPDFDTPAAIKEAAVQAIAANNTHYVSGRGIPSLRARIAKKLNEENGIVCDAGNILVTPGAKAAIYVAVRTLLAPGEEAIVLDPSWLSYAAIVQASGASVRKVELSYTGGHSITLEKLETARSARTRLLIVNSPNNPTGRMLSQEEAGAIASFASRYNLCVIADEIYEKIVFDGRSHISLGAIPEIADRVVTINGLSKSAAMTGWRVGYLCANATLVDRMYMLHQHVATCISGFAQEAALVALDCTEEVAFMRAAYEARRNMFVEQLQGVPGVTCRFPEGAFYAWVSFDISRANSMRICEYLLQEAQVASVPGEAYGLGGENCVRFSLAASEGQLRTAAKRIAATMEKHSGVLA